MQKTSKFIAEINSEFKDKKRDIIIINREYRYLINKAGYKETRKWYKYHCNKCSYEGWIIEVALINQSIGCSCCSGHTLVEGINDIPTVAPWMINCFQGGYDEAKLYTRNSSHKIYPMCPDCGRIRNKKININQIYNTNSVGCSCGDKISYPEKFTFSVLEQLGIDFITQLNKSTFSWCNKYYYDFYFKLNGEQYIIETHGLQHYKNSFSKIKGAKTLEEEQENDKIKKELALNNGIKEENYIVIDCSYSELEWIKEYILASELNQLFDLSNIDWLKAEEFTCSNLVKIACNLWEDGIHSSTKISKIMKISYNTVRIYLKKGAKLSWCNYDPKEAQKESGKSFSKPVEVFKNNVSLGIFESALELERESKGLFGVKLDAGNISKVCNGKRNHSQGYIIKYV